MEKAYTEEELLEACRIANADESKIVKKEIREVEYTIEVLEWNYEDQEVEQQKIDPETGEPMYDEEGNPIMEIVTIRVRTTPIMVEEEIINPETGEKEIVEVQKHHTETRTKMVEFIEVAPDPEYFTRNFFLTSLGYVSRIVHMANGTEQDFLKDVLANLKIGVQIVTYDEKGNKQLVTVTDEFIRECQAQYQKDFYGGNK